MDFNSRLRNMIGSSNARYRHVQTFLNRYFISNTNALNIIKIHAAKHNPGTLKASFGQLDQWRTNMVLVPNLYIADINRYLILCYSRQSHFLLKQNLQEFTLRSYLKK